MKTNHASYVVIAIVMVVIGFALWGMDKAATVNEEVDTTTPTNTVTTKPKTQPVINITKDSVPTVPTESSLNGLTFRMISYNGIAVPTNSKYTLSFNNNTLSAKFCNNMGGTFVLDGSLIKVANLTSTLMACATPSNLMTIESDFSSMLGVGAVIYQSDNTIILSHSKGTVMVFKGF